MIQEDKKKHAVVGAIIGALFAALGWWGFIIGWAVIVGFELYQEFFTSDRLLEFMDIVWGGVAFTVLWFIFYFSRKMKQRKHRR